MTTEVDPGRPVVDLGRTEVDLGRTEVDLGRTEVAAGYNIHLMPLLTRYRRDMLYMGSRKLANGSSRIKLSTSNKAG
ncbi:hypothetical protein RUND412_011350 [Rhizina undulata]